MLRKIGITIVLIMLNIVMVQGKSLYLIGDSLFHTNYALNDSTQTSCATCHFERNDTFNWVPDLSDLKILFFDKDTDEIKEQIAMPLSDVGMDAHNGIDLSDEEMSCLIHYLANVEVETRQSINFYRIKIVLLAFLVLLTLLDRMFKRLVKVRYVHSFVLALLFIFLVQSISAHWFEQQYKINQNLFQPIKFSHKVHVSDQEIQCFYCHSKAYSGENIGLPNAQLCLNCHQKISEGSHSGEFEIQKIVWFYKQGGEIPWLKVHELPQDVRFNHGIHMQTAGLECVDCHTDVEEMHQLQNKKAFTMQWCLDCHASRQIEQSKVYYKQHLNKNSTHNKKDTTLSPVDLGGWDCINCHR